MPTNNFAGNQSSLYKQLCTWNNSCIIQQKVNATAPAVLW